MKLMFPNLEKIPLTKLPYDFQKRLIALAPLRILNDLGRVVQNVKMFRAFCPKAYDQVFITDHPNVYKWAAKDTFLFEIFKYLHQFALFKYLIDGEDNMNPVWQTVLCVDEIIERKQQIYVENTLILYCDSISAYQKVIPFICGPYTRLILHGNINFHQVLRLTHSGVKKIRINANIEIPPLHYDYFAELMVNQVRDFTYSFTLYNNKSLEETLQLSCRRQKKCFNYKEYQLSSIEYYSITTYGICFSLMLALVLTFFNFIICVFNICLLYFIQDRLYETLFIFILYIDFFLFWYFQKRIFYPERFNTVDEIDSDVLQNIDLQNFVSAALTSLWDAIDGVLYKVYKLVVKE